MHALICGSIAYDTIMVFQDRFKNHILPDKIHILNVCFLAPEMRREFGGCATNIAYNLHLLGSKPLAMATAGEDIAPYRNRLAQLGISDRHIRTVPDTFTAQAFITTDLDDNQIIAFHPGAMNHSHLNHIAEANEAQDVNLGILSPDGREGMLQHAREFKELGIPFIFDPGQGMPMFTADELRHFASLADYVTMNDYEAQLMQEKTGENIEALAKKVKAFVVTQGGEGSTIYTSGKQIKIPSAKPDAIVDPTGCGDAYRAGLIHGIQQGWDWETTGRLASLMGAIKIAQRGAQNHAPTKTEIDERFRAAFGRAMH